MKKVILAVLTAAAVTSAQAQLFSPESNSGALLGGIAGGIIGANTGGHHTGRGIAIGAASGLVLGSLFSEANRDRYGYGYSGYPSYSYPSYSYYGGYDSYRGYGYNGYYGYSAPSYSYYSPSTYYAAPQPAPAAQQPQQVTIINNYYSSPMSGANSLFGR
jgi:hypothetical protein